MYNDKIKDWAVVRHIYYDFNLTAIEGLCDFDTLKEAQEYITELKGTKAGLSQSLHIFKRFKEEE